MKILNGKILADENLKILKEKISKFSKKLELHIILVGEDFGSKIYVNIKKKVSESIGIFCEIHKFSENSNQEEILETIKTLNQNSNVSGILVQLPLPKKFDKLKIINAIDPEKDVDGLTNENLGLLFQNSPKFVPATPLGILEILKFYKIDILGKNVCIIGSSLIVGIPLFAILKHLGATISVCDKNTKNLQILTKNADIVISATGVSNLINKDFVKKGSVLIDVGTSKDENGKLCGDFDFKSFENFDCQITPVPNGVGPMTVYALLKNVVKSFEENL